MNGLDKLTTDELIKEIDRLKKSVKSKKFGLVWQDIPESFEVESNDRMPTLQSVISKDIRGDGVNPHIFIEGENYHALTCLNYTHKQKIDVIYIDPPYNTGEDGFRYKDRRIIDKFPDGVPVPKDSPFRHSYWISFMKKRLELAKNLLKEDGVIIVHIDENEIANLQQLMDGVFLPSNFLGTIVWNKKNPKGDAKSVSNMHEYILVYSKNIESFKSLDSVIKRQKPNVQKMLSKANSLYSRLGKNLVPEEIKEVIKPFNYSKEIIADFKVLYDLRLVNKEFQAWLTRQPFSGGEKAYKYIDEDGHVYRGVSMAWPNKDKAPDSYFIPLKHPITGKDCPVPARGWRNPPATMERLTKKNLIIFGANESKQPERKYLLHENVYENTPSILEYAGSDDAYFNELGISFPYAKPKQVAKYLIESIHPSPKIVLDFFAGSGTTLHASLEIASVQQAILVTNNEDNIIDSVTLPRITKELNNRNKSLKYYKTDFIGSNYILKASDNDTLAMAKNAGELLALSENTLENVESTENYQFYIGSDSVTAIYFKEELNAYSEFVQKVNMQTLPVFVYVFSWGNDVSFEDFVLKDTVTVKPMPRQIMEIYKAIYNLEIE